MISAADLAKAIDEKFPDLDTDAVDVNDVLQFIVKEHPDVTPNRLEEALLISSDIARQAEAERDALNTVYGAIVDLTTSLSIMKKPAGRDEGIGVALKRAPAGHPAHALAARMVHCACCGSKFLLIQTMWLVQDESAVPACPSCESTDIHLASNAKEVV